MIYASDTPYHCREMGLVFLVWGDLPTEAHPAMYAVGADPDICRRHDLNAWEAYRVTPVQFADLCALGLQVTDRFGPARWCAVRDGRADLVARLDAARVGARR